MKPTVIYEVEAQRVMAVAQLVQGIDLDLVVQIASRADSIMPIVDPTAWKNSSGEYRKVAELAGLLQPFQRRAAEIIQEAEAKMGHPREAALDAQRE